MYHLTENPDIVYDDVKNSSVSRGTFEWSYYEDWMAQGNTSEPIPQPTFQDYVDAFTPGLQRWMEQVAISNAYDSVLSCCSYVDDAVHQFAQDAAAMRAWRSALWQWAAEYQVNAGGVLPNPLPTIEEIIALAPQPETFGWVTHTPGKIIESQAPVEQTS